MMIWYHCLRKKTITPAHHAKNNIIKIFMEYASCINATTWMYLPQRRALPDFRRDPLSNENGMSVAGFTR
ncbi:hypothetical protein [Xenorhabdus sp. TH1]|uniref:hypothetical protein n=1 Tax=Xenorhabdus sp. TH1 TaxID=3130166 RepID=UPI0030D41CCB